MLLILWDALNDGFGDVTALNGDTSIKVKDIDFYRGCVYCIYKNCSPC